MAERHEIMEALKDHVLLAEMTAASGILQPIPAIVISGSWFCRTGYRLSDHQSMISENRGALETSYSYRG
jgi:hypothetical protein